MQSYNYNHFETSVTIENEQGLTGKDIDEARKSCQRLTDNAIEQYKKAKIMETKRANHSNERSLLEREVERILQKPEGERTVNELAKVKSLQDAQWQEKYDYNYDEDWDEEEDYYWR